MSAPLDPPSPPSIRSLLFGPALRALALYWPAFVLFQLAAGASVVAYYHIAGFRHFTGHLLVLREWGGLYFVMLANIISGALVPELAKIFLRPKTRTRPGLADWLHLIGLMALLGLLVDRFYALQAHLFGVGFEWWRLAVKVAFDQFVFSPFFALPSVLIAFAWRENHFRIGVTLRSLTPSFFLRRIPPLFIPNLAFWIPSLIAIYALPSALQFVLFLFLNSAWCLILIFIAREGDNPPPPGP